MTHTQTLDTQTEETTGRRARWPLFGAAAGLLGFAATMPLDGRDDGAEQHQTAVRPLVHAVIVPHEASPDDGVGVPRVRDIGRDNVRNTTST